MTVGSLPARGRIATTDWLPAVPSHRAGAPGAPAGGIAFNVSAISLLIVDDDTNVRDALSKWFTMRGFAVTCAVDGVDAVEQASGGSFDLITLDLEMPRMGGLDALPELRSLQPGAKIVVLTGYSRDSDEALSRGAAKVLLKPMRLTALEEELLAILHGTSTSS